MRKQHMSGNGKKKRVSHAALVVCLMLLVILAGVVIGRYQHQLRSDGSVRAKEFYFTSDFLDGNTHTLAPGSTQITFTLGNHADELRYSEVDITYEVTVTATDSTAIAPTVGYGNMGKKFTKDVIEDHTVTITGLQPGAYTITAIGKGGYEKILTATIEVLSEEAQLYQYQEKTPAYTLLTVWNEGSKDGSVTLAYAGIPDNTNPNMTNWITGTEGEHQVQENILIPAHTSKVFRFFNSGTITVTQGGTPVASKVPN